MTRLIRISDQNLIDGRTVAVLTFGKGLLGRRTLPNGDYTLATRPNRVHDGQGRSLTAASAFSFRRRLWDFNGDGRVVRSKLRLARREGLGD